MNSISRGTCEYFPVVLSIDWIWRVGALSMAKDFLLFNNGEDNEITLGLVVHNSWPNSGENLINLISIGRFGMAG